MERVKACDCVTGGLPRPVSVTVTVKGKLPLAAGVPVIRPPVESVRPAGRAPLVIA